MAAIQVTLTTADTAYQVLALLRAIDVSIPGDCRTLLFEADAANAEDSKISVGDASIGASRYGYQLGPGDNREYQSAGGPRNAGVKIGPIYVSGSEDGLKLNVEVSL